MEKDDILRSIKIGLPVVILIALVFVITYMQQVVPPPPPPPVAAGTLPPIYVPETVAVWDLQRPSYLQEFELGTKSHYDFWVGNTLDEPTTVTLQAKSCTCAYVEAANVDPSELAALAQPGGPLAAALKNFGKANFQPGELGLDPLKDKVSWKPLEVNVGSFTIPKADPRTGVQLAVIRMNFEAKNPGSQRITAEFVATGADRKPQATQLQVGLVAVSPAQVFPPIVRLGDVKAGETRTQDFFIWSATRDQFPLTLPPTLDDRCITFGEPQLLTGKELEKQLFGAIREAIVAKTMPPGMPEPRPKYGYKITMTLRERNGDAQLDLGPLERRLKFNAGSPFEADAQLSGVVRGDVQLIGAKGNEDRINLGGFDTERPCSKNYRIQVAPTGMKLRFVSAKPDVINVTLVEKDASAQMWMLKVDVPANTVSGPFPPDSHVTLETVGPQPRRVRLPIDGAGSIK